MKKTCIVFMSHFILNVSYASPPLKPPALKIEAHQMDCDQAARKCVATGNAIAKQLQNSKTNVLKADQLIAHFSLKNGEKSPQITRLEAIGNVFFIDNETTIQAEKGHYEIETGTAEFFHHVKITHSNNQLEGDYGKIHLHTGRYLVKNETKPVQALIFASPQNSQTQKR